LEGALKLPVSVGNILKRPQEMANYGGLSCLWLIITVCCVRTGGFYKHVSLQSCDALMGR